MMWINNFFEKINFNFKFKKGNIDKISGSNNSMSNINNYGKMTINQYFDGKSILNDFKTEKLKSPNRDCIEILEQIIKK